MMKKLNTNDKITIDQIEYTITKTLGSGAHGCAYKATYSNDNKKEKTIVIKAQTSLEKATTEFNNINTILGKGNSSLMTNDEENITYITMPYFEGETLASFSKKPLTLCQRFEIAKALQTELKKISEKKYAHLDLHLNNILISSTNEPPKITAHIIDFGNAIQITEHSTLPLYEQARRFFFQIIMRTKFPWETILFSKVNESIDIYSLGHIFKKIFPECYKVFEPLLGDEESRIQKFEDLNKLLANAFEHEKKRLINTLNSINNTKNPSQNPEDHPPLQSLINALDKAEYDTPGTINELKNQYQKFFKDVLNDPDITPHNDFLVMFNDFLIKLYRFISVFKPITESELSSGLSAASTMKLENIRYLFDQLGLDDYIAAQPNSGTLEN